MLEGNPCLACAGPMAATAVDVVTFVKAASQLLSSFGLLRVKIIIFLDRRWWCYGVIPFLKAPSWSPRWGGVAVLLHCCILPQVHVVWRQIVCIELYGRCFIYKAGRAPFW